MAEPRRHGVRRQAEPERPAVDVEGRHRRVAGLVDAGGGTLGIGVEQARRERGVPEAGGHEDVGRGAALEQPPADVGPIGERVLRRRRVVIDAGHVDPGAAVEQPVGDLDRLRLVQRLLTVAAAGVDERGIGVHEALQILEPAESRRDVRRQRRAPFEEPSRRRLVGIVEHRVGAVLPVAAQVHVGARANQHVEQRRVLRRGMRGALAEVEHRIVDVRAHVVQRDELLRARDVLATHRLAERLDVALLEVGDELRPRREAGLAGDGELGVGERERPRGLAGVRSHRADAGERGGDPRRALPGSDPWRACAAVRDWRVQETGGRVRRGHVRPPSQCARVRIMG